MFKILVGKPRRSPRALVAKLLALMLLVTLGACSDDPAPPVGELGLDSGIDGRPPAGDAIADTVPADGDRSEAAPADGPPASDGPAADAPKSGDGPAADGPSAPDGLPPSDDATPDTSTPTPDTGIPTPDTGTPDTGTPDTGTDTGTPDTGTPIPDAGSPDAPPVGCGNGIREAGEECDDGNQLNLDGCSASCSFEQVMRVDYLQLQYTTSAACSQNAFGGAITNPLAQGQIQGAIDSGVADGSITVLFGFVGLDDLSGSADSALQVGVMGGSPVAGAGYSGTSDLDWWYTVDTQTINASRQPIALLPGSITTNTLSLGPGNMALSIDLGGGAPATLSMSNVTVVAQTAAVSTPTASAGSTPGHTSAEQLDPTLQSFSRAGQPTASGAGRLCGDISAESLDAVPVPQALTGLFGCLEGYTVANHSLLDVLIGGCSILFVGQVIAPTQPDTDNAGAPAVGAGPPYTLAADPQRRVASCRDSSNATVNLSACLQDAAYSSFFRLAAGRVIGK
jgi:cysteine-rich repeat protein